MKKNYIKPVSKIVTTDFETGYLQVHQASVIGYGGVDDGTHDPEAPEMPDELSEDKKNPYSLW